MPSFKIVGCIVNALTAIPGMPGPECPCRIEQPRLFSSMYGIILKTIVTNQSEVRSPKSEVRSGPQGTDYNRAEDRAPIANRRHLPRARRSQSAIRNPKSEICASRVIRLNDSIPSSGFRLLLFNELSQVGDTPYSPVVFFFNGSGKVFFRRCPLFKYGCFTLVGKLLQHPFKR